MPTVNTRVNINFCVCVFSDWCTRRKFRPLQELLLHFRRRYSIITMRLKNQNVKCPRFGRNSEFKRPESILFLIIKVIYPRMTSGNLRHNTSIDANKRKRDQTLEFKDDITKRFCSTFFSTSLWGIKVSLRLLAIKMLFYCLWLSNWLVYVGWNNTWG